MIDIKDKTFKQILDSMLSRVSGALNKREGSLIRTSLSAAAWAIEGLYIWLEYVQGQAYALTATGEYLDYKAAERGILRKPATKAVRQGTFNIQPKIGDNFAAKGVSPLLSFTVVKLSSNYCLLECDQEGEIGNSYSGELVALSFVPGLTFAEIGNIIEPGVDEESDDDLRKRYLEALKTFPFGGNIAAYREFILKREDVGAVQIYPTWAGAGTVKCVILNADMGVASKELIDAVQAAVCPKTAPNNQPTSNGLGMAPIGARATITSATEQNVVFAMEVALIQPETIETLKPKVETILKQYIDETIRKSWGKQVAFDRASYSVVLYVSQVISRIMENVETVTDVRNVLINNQPIFLRLEQSKTRSQLPKFLNVVIREV